MSELFGLAELPQRIEFSVIGEAKPAGSKRPTIAGGRLRTEDSAGKPGKDWSALVQDRALEAMQGREPLGGPLRLELVFYRPRPSSHMGKRGLRASAPPFPITRPDALKLARRVEDALKGICYHDDSQIVDGRQRKVWGSPARCEVILEEQQ